MFLKFVQDAIFVSFQIWVFTFINYLSIPSCNNRILLMGTTERSLNDDDDAQIDTSSSTSSGNGYEEKEKEDVGCFVIEVKTNGDDEIGREDVAADDDSNQVDEKTDYGSRSVIVEINNEQTAIDDDKSEMGSSSSSSSINSYSNEKIICRICHLGSDEINQSITNSELIQLGCGCKDELGFSHMQCAETWFKQKGNIRCEICGMIAKNIRRNLINVEEENQENQEMRRVYMVQLSNMNLMETANNNMNFSSENARLCHRTICNMVMAFIIMMFFLPWFLHTDLY